MADVNPPNPVRPRPILEVRGLSRRTAGGMVLLDDVSLSISGGDRLAFAGPSGAGKSLLLRSLAWLDPFDGELLWNGEPVSGDAVPEFRSQVMYLSQNSPGVEGTVEENLRFPFSLDVHRTKSFDKDWCLNQLKRFSKDADFLRRDFGDLSGGERQIVALLRAAQLTPAVILFDESTGALDPESEEVFESVVDEWWRESPERRASVWVSHDLRQRQRVCDRQLRLERGRIAEAAS